MTVNRDRHEISSQVSKNEANLLSQLRKVTGFAAALQYPVFLIIGGWHRSCDI